MPTTKGAAAAPKEETKAKRPKQATQSAQQGQVVEGKVPELELFVPAPISDVDLAKLNVHQRWNRIIGEMGIIPKRGFNAHHKYWFTTDADLNAFVGPLFSKYHLVVIPSVTSVERFDPAPQAKLYLTRVGMHVKVINADNPDDSFEVDWIGEGGDTIDKGVYKAFTGGLKYFYMKLLQVSTGDDPEVFTRTDEIAEGRAGVQTLSDESGSTGGAQVRQVRGRHQPERGGRQGETTEAQIKAMGNLSQGMGLGPLGVAEEIDRVTGSKLVDTLNALEGDEPQRAALIIHLKAMPGEDTGKVLYALQQIATRKAEIGSEQAQGGEYAGPPESDEEMLAQAREDVSAERPDDTPEAQAADASGATTADLDGSGS